MIRNELEYVLKLPETFAFPFEMPLERIILGNNAGSELCKSLESVMVKDVKGWQKCHGNFEDSEGIRRHYIRATLSLPATATLTQEPDFSTHNVEKLSRSPAILKPDDVRTERNISLYTLQPENLRVRLHVTSLLEALNLKLSIDLQPKVTHFESP